VGRKRFGMGSEQAGSDKASSSGWQKAGVVGGQKAHREASIVLSGSVKVGIIIVGSGLREGGSGGWQKAAAVEVGKSRQ
jgi:hypothetical protein